MLLKYKSLFHISSLTSETEFKEMFLKLQTHLLGVFENVNQVKFHSDEYDKMIAVISREGDEIPVSSIC